MKPQAKVTYKIKRSTYPAMELGSFSLCTMEPPHSDPHAVVPTLLPA